MAKTVSYKGVDYDFTGISSDNSNQFGWDDVQNSFAVWNMPRFFQRIFNKGEGLQYVNNNTLNNLISQTVNNGRALTLDEFKKVDGMSGARYWQGTTGSAEKNWKDLYQQYLQFINQNSDKFGYSVDNEGNTVTPSIIDPNTGEELDPNSDRAKQLQLDEARNIAYNSYWNNLFDRNREGSLGQESYQQLLTAEQNAALGNIDLANAQAQQLGLAQAQTVKNITDQLKAERMSMLRAGMSESQIANQDMQQMIANTNALNEQIAASNMAALQGRQQYDNAQQTAYQNWLNAMNQTATNAAAMAAADTGDPNMQTLKRMNKTGESYGVAWNNVTGQKQ